MVPPATIAKGATMNATEKKSTADLIKRNCQVKQTNVRYKTDLLDGGSPFDGLEVHRPIHRFIRSAFCHVNKGSPVVKECHRHDSVHECSKVSNYGRTIHE